MQCSQPQSAQRALILFSKTQCSLWLNIFVKQSYCLVQHSAQNFAPASILAPQFVQNFSAASGLPHSGQNLPPPTFAPQCGQDATMVCLNLSAETYST